MESERKFKPQSIGIILSYAFASLGGGALTQAFGVRTYDFYENEMGLSTLLLGAAWLIYSIWNAINDPLLGYYIDKKNRFTNRFGKRYPWIVGSLVPFSIAFVMIFLPPSNSQWGLFLWCLFTICLFDTAYTIWGATYSALFPDKFRTHKERNKVTSFRYFFSMLGLVIGLLVPPFFLEYGNHKTFVIAAVIVSGFSFLTMLISLPGSKDTPEMIARDRESQEKPASGKEIIQTFMGFLRQRNIRAYYACNLCAQCFQVILLASVPYYVRSILKLEPITETILMAATLAFVVISLPFWYKIMNTKGTKFTLICSSIIAGIGLFPLAFIENLYVALIPMVAIGIGLAGSLVGTDVAGSDILDEDTVKHNHRKEGAFYGLNGFVIRISLVIEALSFSIIHFLTNYVEGASEQPYLAIIGIKIHFAIIPMIFTFALAFIIWKWYDLTPERAQKNKEILKSLNL